MKNIKIILVILLAGSLLASCHNENTKNEMIEEAEKNVIEITNDQFAAAKMVLGSPTPYLFKETVHTKGYVKPAPDGIAQISVTLPGKVGPIKHNLGEYVKKGATLFFLEGDVIIQLQQEYAQNSAQLELAKLDMERLQTLTNDNIASKKEYHLARSNYRSLYAAHEGLKARLELINIDQNKVESGTIVSSVAIVAPISGYITECNLIQGEYIDPQKKTFEIVDTNKLKLFVNVFEKDVASLKVGQKIFFYEPDRKDKVFEAELFIIGNSIDNASKTISCVANIDKNSNYPFVNGMYAECAIITSEVNSKAVPSEAIIKDGYNNFLLVKTGEEGDVMQFSKVNVEIGRQEIDYTEVLTNGLKDVLVKGAYNLTITD